MRRPPQTADSSRHNRDASQHRQLFDPSEKKRAPLSVKNNSTCKQGTGAQIEVPVVASLCHFVYVVIVAVRGDKSEGVVGQEDVGRG
jgi:hypothetical protein